MATCSVGASSPPSTFLARLTPSQKVSVTMGKSWASMQPPGVSHGFLLSGGIFTTIDFPGSTYTTADGINNSGQIVGSYQSAGVLHGYLLSGGVFTTIDLSQGALGINDSGQIVGRSGADGFLLSGGIFSTIDFPGSTVTVDVGINNSGQIVGIYQMAGENRDHGFLATPIPTSVPEPSTWGLTVSTLGLIAVWSWRRSHSSSE